jgi:hypothetical protein
MSAQTDFSANNALSRTFYFQLNRDLPGPSRLSQKRRAYETGTWEVVLKKVSQLDSFPVCFCCRAGEVSLVFFFFFFPLWRDEGQDTKSVRVIILVQSKQTIPPHTSVSPFI